MKHKLSARLDTKLLFFLHDIVDIRKSDLENLKNKLFVRDFSNSIHKIFLWVTCRIIY